MMKSLLDIACEACHIDAPRLTGEQVADGLLQLPDWRCDNPLFPTRLIRCFTFADFAQALRFTNAVGEFAEQQNHHPDLLTRWGGVEVTWYTHKIGGLHQNDLVCAAQTDRIFQQLGTR